LLALAFAEGVPTERVPTDRGPEGRS
jgi:hypothetical protein